MSRRRRFDLDAYVADVRDLLADEFGWDDVTSQAFTNTVRPALADASTVTFICDDPISARFRLRNDPGKEPLALRVGHWAIVPDWAAGVDAAKRPGNVRADAITERLTTLLASHGVDP